MLGVDFGFFFFFWGKTNPGIANREVIS